MSIKKYRRRTPAAWQRAVDKLSITFEADQLNGGYPEILKTAGSEEARLRVLRDLGFRIRERWETDYALPGEPPKLRAWVLISGGISVDLSDGFVVRRAGVRR
ncbi:MAG TPA: hypothetical protein VN421_09615 [Pseudoflavonifractor sp.]|nr:hypothetical protein [Pseudoflavonifractor sp.]